MNYRAALTGINWSSNNRSPNNLSSGVEEKKIVLPAAQKPICVVNDVPSVVSSVVTPVVNDVPSVVPSVVTPVVNMGNFLGVDNEDRMKPNYDGGISYSFVASFDKAVSELNKSFADSLAESIVTQLCIFGTCSTRVDISSTVLTAEMRDVFIRILHYNYKLATQTIRNVYVDARAPKNSHVAYLLATVTSITAKDAGSTEAMAHIRSAGYNLVTMFRIFTHLAEWINMHITLCSLQSTKNSGKPSPLEKKENNTISYGRLAKQPAKPKRVKLSRAGGTGKGFRDALIKWYLQQNAMSLAIQITKYGNREGFTHKDILSLVHIKSTSIARCKCKSKAVCKCPKPQSMDLENVVPVATQLSLGYAVYGIERSKVLLSEGITRFMNKNKNKSIKDAANDSDLKLAFNVFTFLCAVEKAKKDSVPSEDTADLVRLFGLTREMVSNTKLNDLVVLNALTVKLQYTPKELLTARVNFALQYGFDAYTVSAFFPIEKEKENEIKVEAVEKVEEKQLDKAKLKIGRPITSLIRGLNGLTKSGLLTPDTNPQANDLIFALTNHLTNKEVLHKGFVHPMNLFNAWATYSKGHGDKGSLVWTPIESLNRALLDATETAFKGLKGFDMPIAFLVDASGSMSSAGSVSGMPGLLALDVAALLMMTFYRATANFAEENQKPMPNHLVGYFGEDKQADSHNRWSAQKVMNNSSANINDVSFNSKVDELETKSAKFKEVSDKMSSKASFSDVKKLLGDGKHLGMTDVGASFWYLIKKLTTSLEQVKTGNPMFKNTTVFQLLGYAELLLMITDNDVNSGDQPMTVLNLYWDLVKEAFNLLPFDKDGSKQDPTYLFNLYTPRLVVVATQGTDRTIGDPFDSRILNLSGFDSNAPVLINEFIKKYQKPKPEPIVINKINAINSIDNDYQTGFVDLDD